MVYLSFFYYFDIKSTEYLLRVFLLRIIWKLKYHNFGYFLTMICHFLWTQIVNNISIVDEWVLRAVYKPSFGIWIKTYCSTCAVIQMVIIKKPSKPTLENCGKRKERLKQSIPFLTEAFYLLSGFTMNLFKNVRTCYDKFEKFQHL